MKRLLKSPSHDASLTSLILLLSLFLGSLVSAEEFAHIKSITNGQRYPSYLNSLSTPAVRIRQRCAKSGNPCWTVVVNQDGQELKYFGSDDSVESLASGRYEEVAYRLVSHSYSCIDFSSKF